MVVVRRREDVEVPLVVGLLKLGFNLKNWCVGVKIITAVEVNFGQAFFIDGKCGTLLGAILIDAAQRIACIVFDEEGTTEENFAAIAALIAFATALSDLLCDIEFSKAQQKETTHFACCLFAYFEEFFGHKKALF